MYGFLEACFGLKYRLGEPLSLEPWKALWKDLVIPFQRPVLCIKRP